MFVRDGLQHGEEKRTEKNLIVRSGISEAETTNNTRSSAVAERPRDVSCLSVVSFNIPTGAVFFITSYCSFRILFRCLLLSVAVSNQNSPDKHP